MPDGSSAISLFDAPLAAVVADGLREAMHRDGLGALRDLAWVSAPEPSICRELLLPAYRNTGLAPCLSLIHI